MYRIQKYIVKVQLMTQILNNLKCLIWSINYLGHLLVCLKERVQMKDTCFKKRTAFESVTAVANPKDHKFCINFQMFTLEVELYCSGIAYAKKVQ